MYMMLIGYNINTTVNVLVNTRSHVAYGTAERIYFVSSLKV